VHGAVVSALRLYRRCVGEWRRLEGGVLHHGAIGRGIRGGRSDTARSGAPDLFQLGGGDIGAIVGSDGGPELLTASFVDCTKAVGVNDLGLMSHFSVDAESVVRLWGVPRREGAGLGEKDLVLVAPRGGADGGCPDVGAASVAHGRAMTG